MNTAVIVYIFRSSSGRIKNAHKTLDETKHSESESTKKVDVSVELVGFPSTSKENISAQEYGKVNRASLFSQVWVIWFGCAARLEKNCTPLL